MKNFSLPTVAIFGIWLAGASVLWGEDIPSYFDVLARGMYMVFDDDFAGAQALFDSLGREYPGDPTPLVFRIIAECSELQDRGAIRFDGSIGKELARAESLCTVRWGKNPASAWANFEMGNLYGQWAMIDIMDKRDFLAAFGKIKTAKKYWERAIDDPVVGAECANGLGNLYYWQSARGGILRSVGVIRDRRAEGINLLRRAAERSKIAKDSALHWLFFALLDFGDTAAAESALAALAERHPHSRTVRWNKLTLALARGECAAAVSVAESLKEYYDTVSEFNTVQLTVAASYGRLCAGDTAAACGEFGQTVSAADDEILSRLRDNRWWKEIYETVLRTCEGK